MSEEKLLDINNLKLHFDTYDGESKVINNISMNVAKGEVISIVGESGCGKSVTVKSLLGLIPSPPAKYKGGDIRFEGKSLIDLSEKHWEDIRGKDISMIFQDPMSSLNPVFTIGEQLTDVYIYQVQKKYLPFSKNKRKLKKEAKEKAIEILEKMRIPDPKGILNRYPMELSGGMRQRILIALALIHTPKLLLADEPGTALDVSVQDQILNELQRLVREEGISMIFITHNLGVAKKISDRIYVMYAGEVVEEALPDELFEEPLHPYTTGLLNSIPKLNAEMGPGIDGMIPNLINPPTGCRFYQRCTQRMDHCKTEKPPMNSPTTNRKVLCHLYNELGD